jgi:hypothetical protein
LIESRFHEQVVYVTIVNSLLGTNSAVDWILWFGERGAAKPGVRVLMRPPAPLKRIGISTLMSAPTGQGRKIHIAGVVDTSGRLSSLGVLGEGGPEAAVLLKALEGCEFTPAFQNGVPVDVNVVIQIPSVQLVSQTMDGGK